MINYILYNPYAGKGGDGSVRAVRRCFPNEAVELCNTTEIRSYPGFYKALVPDDRLILCGGDGTLNRFINDTCGKLPDCEILYYPAGTGNDFARDTASGRLEGPYPIRPYLNNLPTVYYDGGQRLFLNNVGFGIDGYCAERGEQISAESDKSVNYAAIAIKGLLRSYDPTTAVITVDGVRHEYEHVWLSPVMHGRYYGSGMLVAPEQQRQSGLCSVVVMHGINRLKILAAFPSIYKGKHVRHTDITSVWRGREISVEFDERRPMQIDGEVVPMIKGFRVRVPNNSYEE